MRDSNDKAMSIGEHLEELRKRVWLATVGILPIFIVGLVFGKEILYFLVSPLIAALKEKHIASGAMQATQLLEGFLTYIKIAAVLAAVFGGPWILYQLWKFVAPGLYAKERRFIYLLGPLSVFFSVLGLAFMYRVMLPFVLVFFVYFNETLLTRPPTPVVEVPAGFVLPSLPVLAGDAKGATAGQMWLNTEREEVRIAIPDPVATEAAERARAKGDAAAEAKAKAAPPIVLGLALHSDSLVVQQYKIAEYVSLVLTLGLAFALAFQTPIVVLLLGWSGLVDRKTLARYRKYAFLACAGVAAVITPPDLTSMIMLLVPMYGLFEVGLVLLWILPAKRVAAGSVFSRGKESRDGQSTQGDDPTARPDDR